MKNRCDECKNWVKRPTQAVAGQPLPLRDTERGECRPGPPIEMTDDLRGIWPITLASEGCHYGFDPIEEVTISPDEASG